MVYSVWNWDTLRYDYLRSDSGLRPGEPVLARKRYQNGDSVRPEDVLPVLPEDAIRIGSGDTAQGRIAVRKEEASLGQFISQPSSIISTILVLVGGYIIYRIAR